MVKWNSVFTSVIVLSAIIPIAASGQVDSTLVANCDQSTATQYLENGNIRALIKNSGGIYRNDYLPFFEVPIDGGNDAIAADAIWLAGIVNGELRLSGTTYGPNEFWAGPLDQVDQPPSTCAPYDRMWSINRRADFKGLADGVVSAAVADWPADLGAPYHELDGEKGYSPASGDLPMVFGDQMLWWIMNDRGNVHSRTNSNPLGVEVRASAFAFDLGDPLESVLFYRYQIVNRNSVPIEDAYIGRFVDVSYDSGDDYVGTDTTRSLVYTYNADNVDEDRGQRAGGYGEAPPAFGFSIIEASHSNGGLPSDQSADRGDFLTNSLNYSRGPNYAILRDREHWYQQLQSIWSDGSPLTEGRDGHQSSQVVSNYMFPGDPVSGTFWSENNSDGQGGVEVPMSRWLLGSYGPFDLQANESATFTFANIWARGADHLDSVTQLRQASDQVWSSVGHILSPPIPTSNESWSPDPEHPPTLEGPYPNPSNGRTTIAIRGTRSGKQSARVFNILGQLLAEHSYAIAPHEEVRLELDVSRYSSGLYFVLVGNGVSTQALKLFVK